MKQQQGKVSDFIMGKRELRTIPTPHFILKKCQAHFCEDAIGERALKMIKYQMEILWDLMECDQNENKGCIIFIVKSALFTFALGELSTKRYEQKWLGAYREFKYNNCCLALRIITINIWKWNLKVAHADFAFYDFNQNH